MHLSKILEVAMGAEHSTIRYCYKGEAIPFCVGACFSRYFFNLAALSERKKRWRRQQHDTTSFSFLPPCAVLKASTFYQCAPLLYTASINHLTPLIFVLEPDNFELTYFPGTIPCIRDISLLYGAEHCLVTDKVQLRKALKQFKRYPQSPMVIELTNLTAFQIFGNAEDVLLNAGATSSKPEVFVRRTKFPILPFKSELIDAVIRLQMEKSEKQFKEILILNEAVRSRNLKINAQEREIGRLKSMHLQQSKQHKKVVQQIARKHSEELMHAERRYERAKQLKLESDRLNLKQLEYVRKKRTRCMMKRSKGNAFIRGTLRCIVYFKKFLMYPQALHSFQHPCHLLLSTLCP